MGGARGAAQAQAQALLMRWAVAEREPVAQVLTVSAAASSSDMPSRRPSSPSAHKLLRIRDGAGHLS